RGDIVHRHTLCRDERRDPFVVAHCVAIRAQHPLWTSTGTKNPGGAGDTPYEQALVAPRARTRWMNANRAWPH
ncbi:MAG: hypothetical protein RBT39_12135, partial [Azoarcus sp.]|nr:hypothetical protein [Azoarcus sp.]